MCTMWNSSNSDSSKAYFKRDGVRRGYEIEVKYFLSQWLAYSFMCSIEGFRGSRFVDNRKDGWIWPWGRGCGRCSWSWWGNKGETEQSCEDSLLQQLIASVKVNKSSKSKWNPLNISNTSTRVSEFCNIQQQFYHYIVNKNIGKHFMKLAFLKIDMTQSTIGVQCDRCLVWWILILVILKTWFCLSLHTLLIVPILVSIFPPKQLNDIIHRKILSFYIDLIFCKYLLFLAFSFRTKKASWISRSENPCSLTPSKSRMKAWMIKVKSRETQGRESCI